MYTLSDIYNKLNLNTYIPNVHITSTTTSPASSFNTLTEIWNSIPIISASTIATGTIIMGVVGTNPSYTYGSTSPSGVLYSTAPGAGTANNPAGATGGRTLADGSKILSDSYAFSTDGTIINGTGVAGATLFYESYPLTWSAEQTGLSWDLAKTTCATMSPAQRLPTVSELVAALRAQWLEGTEPGPGDFNMNLPYWTNSNHDINTVAAVSGNPGGTDVEYANKNLSIFFRCVR